jgi:hypothetical protein
MRTARLMALAIVSSVLSLSLFAWGRTSYFTPATPQELAMTNVAFAPGAPAVVLNWVRRQDDNQAWEEEYLRIKVFREEGKKYGDIELPYVPGFSAVKNIEARTIHADGTIVPFTGQVYDKVVVKARGTAVRAKTFSLPDVQPGSILEYSYTRSFPVGFLFTSRWDVQRELPVVKAQLWLKPYEQDYSSYFTHANLPAGKLPTRVGDHFELNLDNVPAYEKEPFSPPESVLKPHVDYFYIEGTLEEPAKYWNKVARERGGYIEDFMNGRDAQNLGKTLANGAATPDEKLRRIYARVQQLRNLSYEQDKTEQESSREKLRDNKSVDDVLRNGYGYRGELTRLFVTLARAAGFDASVLEVAQRDEYFFSQNLPDAKQLNGEVALVMIDNQPHYFDPGTPTAPFETLSWENTSTRAMRMAKKSDAVWINMPDAQPTQAIEKRVADLTLEGDVLKGKAKVTFTGQEALARRMAVRHSDEAASKKNFEELAKGWFPDGAQVKLTKLSGLKSWEEAVVAEYDVELPNIGSIVGSRALVPMSVFAVGRKNPFAAEQRKNPVYFDYAYEVDDEVTFHLPEGFEVEALPKDATIDRGAVSYKNSWVRKDRDVTYKRAMVINALLVPADKYKIVRDFYSKAGAADQEALVLRKGGAK